MKILRIYNKDTRQIEYYYNEPTSAQFWDRHWNKPDFRKQVMQKKNRFIEYILRKYIKDEKAKILEAGCGNGHIVYFLNYKGYDVYGIDFAKETVNRIIEEFPELKIKYGDVKALEFEDTFFDLYISGGVIEHKKKDYKNIIIEAIRVIKPNGYIVVAFPYMSPLRKIKAYLGLYRSNNISRSSFYFYQYVFDYSSFVRECNNLGLLLIEKIKVSGLKGFKDEVAVLRPFLQKIYEYKGKSLFIIGIRGILTFIFTFFSAHAIWVILKKKKEKNNIKVKTEIFGNSV